VTHIEYHNTKAASLQDVFTKGGSEHKREELPGYIFSIKNPRPVEAEDMEKFKSLLKPKTVGKDAPLFYFESMAEAQDAKNVFDATYQGYRTGKSCLQLLLVVTERKAKDQKDGGSKDDKKDNDKRPSTGK